MQRARDKGCSTFRALVFGDNFRSLKLFEKLGCRKVGTYDFFLGIPNLSNFQKNTAAVSGYINADWAFTYFPENKPLRVDSYHNDGWKVIKTTGSTFQILQRGENMLKLKNPDGFTCVEKRESNADPGIFETDTEKSTGIILEMSLE